jgi:hypothetical protein
MDERFTNGDTEHEEGQGEMFAAEDAAEKFIEEIETPFERKFDVDLSLTLKPENGKAYKIPLLTGAYYGKRIEELLELALKSRRSKKIINAMLDNPEGDVSIPLDVIPAKSGVESHAEGEVL